MVGNTYSYGTSDWQADISAAADQAIDGFALNIGIEGWQTEQAAAAYKVAEAQGSFKMFLSLDMTSLPCGSPADAQRLINIVRQHASSPAQAKYNGEVLVSTFAGSECTFGTGTNGGWQTAFVDPLVAGGLKIAFIPSVFMSPSEFPNHMWMDGEFNWNSAWPMGNHDIDTTTDRTFRAALGGRAYMTAVSPYFFTHFGANSWNKNWIYRSDNWLYCTRWEQIIAQRGVSTMTEILTWNDYGESSYIGPIRGSLPATSDRWVNGFDHSALAPITKYYATAFKTGAYPAIEQDRLVVWARPHAARADAPDPVGRPTGYDWTDDNLYAVVFATAPSVATLTSGGNSMSFSVPAGLSKIKMPLSPGAIGGSIERGGQHVASYDSGAQFSFTTTPAAYNYNYWVGSS
jgi:glucan endo-1,3-alpha-glucosidase